MQIARVFETGQAVGRPSAPVSPATSIIISIFSIFHLMIVETADGAMLQRAWESVADAMGGAARTSGDMSAVAREHRLIVEAPAHDNSKGARASTLPSCGSTGGSKSRRTDRGCADHGADNAVVRSRLFTPRAVRHAMRRPVDSGRLCRCLQRRSRPAAQPERDHYPGPAAENQAQCEREPDEP